MAYLMRDYSATWIEFDQKRSRASSTCAFATSQWWERFSLKAVLCEQTNHKPNYLVERDQNHVRTASNNNGTALDFGFIVVVHGGSNSLLFVWHLDLAECGQQMQCLFGVSVGYWSLDATRSWWRRHYCPSMSSMSTLPTIRRWKIK